MWTKMEPTYSTDSSLYGTLIRIPENLRCPKTCTRKKNSTKKLKK